MSASDVAVEVTQADRQAAADGCGSVSKARVIRRGEMDHTVLVQAFARHRLTTSDETARLRTALEQADMLLDVGHGNPSVARAHRLIRTALQSQEPK